MTENPNNL